METCIDYVDYDVAVVSTDEQKYHRRLRAWRDEYPDLVRIKTEPEGNYGNMVAVVPTNWVVLRPPKGLKMSDEEKVARAKILRNWRQSTAQCAAVEQTKGEHE